MSDHLEDARLPLSAAQLGLWAAQQLDPGSPRYNCGAYLEIEGPVDEELMRHAVRIAVQEADGLRANVDDRGQIIGPTPDEALEPLDMTGHDDPRSAAEEWMRADLSRPVDLRLDPLVRHVLIKDSTHTRLLYLRHHHIVLDGFGQTIHWRRIAEIYSALAAGEQPPPARSVPLRELLAEDAAYPNSAAYQRDRAYWLAQLADRPGTAISSGRRSNAAKNVLRRTAELGAQDAAALHGVAKRLGTTPPAVLVAAVAAYECRTAGRAETVLNLPVPARRTKASRATPAMLANQLPLRVEAARDASFAELVEQVTSRLADTLRHQRFRGEQLHRELGLAGSREQLAGTTVNVLTFGDELVFGGTRSTSHFLSAGPVRELSVNFFVDPDESSVELVLDADAEACTPQALAAHESRLLTLLRHALREPERMIGGLDLMRADERRAVLEAGQGPVRDYDLSQCLHELVEAQARRTPEGIAVQVEGAALTYGELVDRARRLAARLRELGAGPGQIVGVHDERSLELVVDLLAVLMSGAGYLPLDPELPPERLAFQIEDAAVRTVLSRTDLAGRLAGVTATVLAVDEVLPGLPEVAHLPPAAAPQDTAYVIYTSGSTGRPKGVAVPHRGVVNRLLWMQQEYQLGPPDRVLQKTPFTFDVSVWEFFWPLLTGARLHLMKPGAHRDPRAIAEAVREHGISTLHFVPTMLDLFLAEPSAAGLDSVRHVIASGEALNPETVGRFFARYGEHEAGPRLHNLYGPTEASIDVTYWRCRATDADGVVPIGRPVANTAVYVLDPDGQPAPFGVQGELHIGGVQVATGYVNRAGLTAQRFVDNPFGYGKLYRTGDLAVLRADGVVEYLGRLDHQIKVRGFRVEPGEIESVLLSHPAVAAAVVVAPVQADGQRRLLAYVVASGTSVDTEELLALSRERLPEYMVPAHILVQGSFPLLASGKVDRSALPNPGLVERAADDHVEPPVTEAERLVHEVWCEVLGRAVVDVRTSFFVLGGDSISSIRMRAALEARGRTFTVAEFFQAPTVRALADRLRPFHPDALDRGTVPFSLLRPADRQRLPADVQDAYPLTNLQSGMVFHASYEESTSVYRVVTSVHVGLPFAEPILRQALAAVFRRHPALRTSFHLTGFSEPLQLVHREVTVPLEIRDELLDADPAAQDDALAQWAGSVKFHEFELTAAPLLAFTAHPRGPGSFQLGVVEHHVVLDGWSDMAMMDEILLRYRALLAGEQLWLPEVRSTYHRFVAAERRAVESPQHREFWAAELAGAESVGLPAASSTGRRVRAQHRRFDVPVRHDVAGRIAEAARRVQLPLKSLLAAAHVAVLHAVCPAEEMLTGVVSHARLEEEGGDEVIGVFLNTLPLRVRVGGATWLQLARKIHEHEGRTAAHRSYPYGQMVRDHGDLAVDSYVNFMDFHQQGGNHPAALDGFGIAETDFPLAVDFMIDPLRGRLELWLDCDIAMLNPAFCQRLAGYYERALDAIATHADGLVDAVDLRSGTELEQLARRNDTVRAYDTEATVHELIGRQIAASPEAPALRHGAESVSYAELDARANRLAHHLRERGVSRGGRVGVNLHRGVDLVIALVAVLRAGAAYVPLDPDFPAQRLNYIATDAALDCLLTDGDTGDGLPAAAVVRVSQDAAQIARQPDTPVDGDAAAQDPIYVMYTSGSTGHPKGTVLRHRNVVNFFAGMQERIGIGSCATVLALTSISFDISVLELLWPLTQGAAVVVAGERMIDNLTPDGGERSFVDLCAWHRPTLIQATPSFLAAVAAEPDALAALSPLRALLVGGEAFPAGLAQQLLAALPSVRVFNMYGPTETTIWSTVHELNREHDTHVDMLPIGRPIANTTLRIVGPGGAETPLGVAGELWIGGDGVAVGYLGREELTAEKFVPGPDDGRRWYRTGDRVRWREDGILEFLGRIDRQVKISGHRVELDEVESVLSRHPEVASVAVVAGQRPNGGTELLAYVAPVGAAVNPEAQHAHVDRWREVWESAYADPETGAAADAERDFAGWHSSYTGGPIPLDEMREWLRHTADRIAALGARRVVDVGVGVGLYLRELAPQTESYHGLDLSDTALRTARDAALAAALPAGRVTLEQGDALALAKLPEVSADLVMFNSVVQYFPDADYLRRALLEAVRVAGTSGAVFVGDVRDLNLLDAFHAHVQVHRAPALMAVRDVAAAAERALAEERELCLAAQFFTDFAATDASVGAVRIELKRGHRENELTRFRFDVSLLGKNWTEPAAAGSVVAGWDELSTASESGVLGGLADLLERSPADHTVTVTGLPNRRLVQPLAALRTLRAEHDAGVNAWDLQRLLWEHDGFDAADPEDVAVLGECHGRAVRLLLAGSGEVRKFDVVFATKER